MPIYINGKSITPKFGGVNLSRVMYMGLKIWPVESQSEIYTYTINSNIEGATVLADGENVGTISGGTCSFSKTETDAKDSYSITLSGGLLPQEDTIYDTFDVVINSQTSDQLNVPSAGDSYTATATSRKRTTSYSYPSSQSVYKNGTITMNYVSETGEYMPVTYTGTSNQSWLTYSGGRITISANSTSSQRSGTITFTQSETNNTDIITFTQIGVTLYTYTINSNCNGGTVYFNDVNKGTISGSKLVFTDAASSGTVRINGGVPSSSSEFVRNDTSTDYDFTSPITSFSWDSDGGIESVDVDSSKQVTTTPIYRDRYYSAPSSQTVSGNTSVTMNYTGPTYGSEYSGESSTSGRTRVGTSWKYDDPSWISKSSSNTGTYKTKWTFDCDSNSGSARSDWDELVQSGSSKVLKFNFSQSEPSYEFKWKSTTSTTLTETADKFLANGQTYGTNSNMSYIQNPFYSKKGGVVDTNISISSSSGGATGSVGTYGGSGDRDLRISVSKNTGTSKRNPSVTIKQNGSGKTLTMTCEQTYIHFRLSEGTENNLSWEFPAGGSQSGGDHALNLWPPLQEYGAPSEYWPSATISGVPSWMSVNKTSGIKNGTQIIFQCQANNTGSTRTATVTLTEDHCGVQRKINFSQPSNEKSYSLKAASLSGSMDSSGYVSIGPSSTTVKFLLTATSSYGTTNWGDIDFRVISSWGITHSFEGMVGNQITLVLSIPANNSGSSRAGGVEMSFNGGSLFVGVKQSSY